MDNEFQDVVRPPLSGSLAEPGAGGTDSEMLAHRRLLSSAALLGTLTILAKLAALAKDWLVARRLGAGDELDAYLVGFLIPSFCAVVLAHSFASGFVPTYIRVWRQKSQAEAQQLFGGVLARGILALVIVSGVMAALEGPLLPLFALGFDGPKLALSHALFYLMVPVVMASGVSAMLASVLNAHERFAAAAFGPMAIALGTLAVYAMFGEHFGVRALAWGTTAGFVAELAILLIAAARNGLLARPRLGRFDGELRKVAWQYLPAAGGGLLMSSSMLVNQSMAASLGSGELSVLNYGGKVVAVVVGVVAVSLSTVMLPRFSQMIAAGRLDQLEVTFRRYAAVILFASLPGLALLALFSEPLVQLLFERGAFTSETTAAVTRVQLCLLPQVPFYVLVMLGARLLSALDGNQTVLRIGALNLAVNVAGNYVLMQWYGVNGIALATSLVYMVATVATVWAVHGKLSEQRRGGRGVGG